MTKNTTWLDTVTSIFSCALGHKAVGIVLSVFDTAELKRSREDHNFELEIEAENNTAVLNIYDAKFAAEKPERERQNEEDARLQLLALERLRGDFPDEADELEAHREQARIVTHRENVAADIMLDNALSLMESEGIARASRPGRSATKVPGRDI